MFGFSPPNQFPECIECLRCECTTVAKRFELEGDGWKLIPLKSGELVALCPDCKPKAKPK